MIHLIEEDRKYELLLRVDVQSDTSPMGGNLIASMKIINAYALWPSNYTSGNFSYRFICKMTCMRLFIATLL